MQNKIEKVNYVCPEALLVALNTPETVLNNLSSYQGDFTGDFGTLYDEEVWSNQP